MAIVISQEGSFALKRRINKTSYKYKLSQTVFENRIDNWFSLEEAI